MSTFSWTLKVTDWFCCWCCYRDIEGTVQRHCGASQSKRCSAMHCTEAERWKHCIICCCSFVVWCPWSSISRSVSSQYSCSSCRRRLASSPWVSWLQRSLPRYQHHAWYFHCAPFSLTTCDNKSNNHHHRRQNRLHLFIFSVWWLWPCGPKIIINGVSSVCKLQLKIQYSISCVTRVSNKLVKDQMRFADTMQPPAVDCREVDLVEVSFGFCCDAVCLINSASSRSSSDVFGSF